MSAIRDPFDPGVWPEEGCGHHESQAMHDEVMNRMRTDPALRLQTVEASPARDERTPHRGKTSMSGRFLPYRRY